MKIKDKPALVLIDIQKGFEDIEHWGGRRNNPRAEENAGILLSFWRQNHLPIFHVKHNSTDPNSKLAKGKPGNEIQDVVKPIDNEPVIEKNVNSAFIGTDLQQRLNNNSIKTLVVAGLTTNHCISTSVRMAGNLGYHTFVVADATAAFDTPGIDGKKFSAELIHETALASLHNEFAIAIETNELLNKMNEK